LINDPIAGVELVAPIPLTAEQLVRIHAAHYVHAIRTGEPRTLAQAQELSWDAGLWPMVLSSNGGAVAAALEAMRSGLSGSLSSGLHHARRDTGVGYCTFNGLVLAALDALDAGAKRVLIIDLDAHCGGGTESLIRDDDRIWQIDVSVDDYDSYESGPRTWLTHVENSCNYLQVVQYELNKINTTGLAFDLCLYNAGMDPFEACPDGGLAGIDTKMLAEREHMVFSWCKARAIPVAFMLAGGYIGKNLSHETLVKLHRLTLSAASAHNY
jgi:acetoin utilization deacetylase AcuC-like enzyme